MTNKSSRLFIAWCSPRVTPQICQNNAGLFLLIDKKRIDNDPRVIALDWKRGRENGRNGKGGEWSRKVTWFGVVHARMWECGNVRALIEWLRGLTNIFRVFRTANNFLSSNDRHTVNPQHRIFGMVSIWEFLTIHNLFIKIVLKYEKFWKGT